MKKSIFLGVLALGAVVVAPTFAQKDNVGIGTNKPDKSAVLDINSTNKGLLIPRMSLQQRNAIQTPAQGLMVYQSDFLSGFYFFDGTQWKPMASGNENNSVAGVDGDWILNSPTILTLDASPLGTSSGIHAYNGPIVLKLANSGLIAGYISPTNTNLSYGYRSSEKLQTGGYSGIFNTSIGTESMLVNTSGSNNMALGYKAMTANIGGSSNVAVGVQSLAANRGGGSNVAIGYQSLFANVSGSFNLGVGMWALRDNTGSGNTGIGYGALVSNTSGTGNLAIGFRAGLVANGSNNIFLGNQAGENELGSNKLYISNSATANPLIKGDFATSTLKINSKMTGYLAVGDFDAASPMPTPVGYRLIVQDGILTEKIKVALKSSATDWADYVFAKDYTLMSLDKVEAFINANKHLPNVPSAGEMVKDGLDVSKTSKMFMEKIEELTLYMIEMNKEIKALKAENAKLKK